MKKATEKEFHSFLSKDLTRIEVNNFIVEYYNKNILCALFVVINLKSHYYITTTQNDNSN